MTNYRTGDQVLLELPATVLTALDGLVRVRFGDVEYEADPASLTMLKRSIHVGDEVEHEGRDGVIAQTLEHGVFLVRFPGATGADAYRVASDGELRHADKTAESPVEHAPAAVAATEEAPAPAPAPIVAAPKPAGDDEPLELTDEIPAKAPTAEHSPERIAGMATSLSSVLGQGGARRSPLNLEALGTTETVKDVRAPRGEMVLDDEMRLKSDD